MAYQVVSGEIGDYKKVALGFRPSDQQDVSVSVKACPVKVIKIDKGKDLALCLSSH